MDSRIADPIRDSPAARLRNAQKGQRGCLAAIVDYLLGCCGMQMHQKNRPITNQLERTLEQVLPKEGEELHIVNLLLLPDPTRDFDKYYDLQGVVGEGGFAQVFRAHHKATGEERAIKRIPAIRDVNVALELEALIRLDHPNIAKFYGHFEDRNFVYVVTEIADGGDFGLLKNGINDESEVRTLLLDMVKAVAYCHDNGVVHRDLKFDNCLIQKRQGHRSIAKIIDFGLAAIRRHSDRDFFWLSDTLGTRYFVAPEVAADPPRYDATCDCWSMGVMLFIIYTWAHPIAERASSLTTGALLRRIVKDRVRAELLTEARVDAAGKDLILKLLCKNPTERIRAQAAAGHPFFLQDNATLSPGASLTPALDEGMLSRAKQFACASRFEKALLTLVAHQTTAAEVDSLRKAFNELDTDRSGSLTKAELQAGIASFNIQLTNQELDSLFTALDADGNGKVQYTEWLAATIQPQTLKSKKMLKEAFSFFDVMQKGFIEREGLEYLLGSIEDADGVLDRGDRDGDGNISYEEFEKLMKNVAARMKFEADRNSHAKAQRGCRDPVEARLGPYTSFDVAGASFPLEQAPRSISTF